MSDITFWKWQQTDRFGLPGVTRYRLVSGTDRERIKEDPEVPAWPLEGREPKQMNDHLRGAPK